MRSLYILRPRIIFFFLNQHPFTPRVLGFCLYLQYREQYVVFLKLYVKASQSIRIVLKILYIMMG
jgi:hypothetical protein